MFVWASLCVCVCVRVPVRVCACDVNVYASVCDYLCICRHCAFGEYWCVLLSVQVYGGPGCGACCRACNLFDNYVLTFPPGATPVDRALLLTSVLQLDYHRFERRKARRR